MPSGKGGVGSGGIEREGKGQLLGFAGPFKESELYSKSDGKPLKGLESGHGIIRCTGLKGYVSRRAENGLNGEKNPDGCPSPAPMSALVPPATLGTTSSAQALPVLHTPLSIFLAQGPPPDGSWPPESAQTPEVEALLADPG